MPRKNSKLDSSTPSMQRKSYHGVTIEKSLFGNKGGRHSFHKPSSDPSIPAKKPSFYGIKKHKASDLDLDLDKPYYPSDFIHGLLSACAYHNHQKGEKPLFPEKSTNYKYNEYLTNWKVLKVFSPKKSDDYYSALYINDSEKYVVLAHRGTDIKCSLKGFNQSLKADLAEILNYNIGLQQIAAYGATEQSTKILEKLNKSQGGGKAKYHFSITGHSLGAWLAELSLYFCYKDFKIYNARAVTFDSPGTKEHLKNFVSNVVSNETKFDYNVLDLTTYLSAPNLVNVCNKHFGTLLRVYPNIADPKEIIKKSLNEPNKKLASVKKLYGKFEHPLDPVSIFQKIIESQDHHAYAFLSLLGHGLDPILDTFDPTTGLPRLYRKIHDWPLLKHENSGNIDVVEETLSEISDRLGVPQFLGRVTSKQIAKRMPKTTIHSMVNVIAEFLDDNIKMDQICESFRHLKNGGSGFEEKTPKDPNAEFSIRYKAHYEVKEIDPYQVVVKDFIKTKPEWFLHKLFKLKEIHYQSKIENIVELSDNVKPYLRTLIDNYTIDEHASSRDNIIIATHPYTIDKLNNAVRNLLEYDSNLPKTITQLVLRRSSSLDSSYLEVSNCKIFSNLPQKIDGFVGRKDIFKKLDKIFLKSDIASISAFAGTGKTSTALEYGHRVKNQNGTLVKWICSETPEKINATYRDLANELEINVENYIVSSSSYSNYKTVRQKSKFNTYNEKKGFNINDLFVNTKTLDMDGLIKAVHTKIASSHSDILFIFDNVGQYEDIQNHISSLQNFSIKALVTTRNQNLLGNKNNNIELNALSKQDAVSYISNTLEKRIKNSDAKILLDFLEKGDRVMPYSLNKAVACLKAKPLWSVQEYIEHRQKNPEHDESTMLLKQIAENNETAWQILQYSSLMDPDFIDVNVFSKLLSLDKNTLQQAITDLQKLSLVKIDNKSQNGKNGIIMDRILQGKCSKYVEHNSTLCLDKKLMVNKLLIELADKMPLVENTPGEKWKVAEKLYPHIENLLQSGVELDNSAELVSIYTKMAEYEKIVILNYDRSLILYENALEMCKNFYGEQHVKVVQIYIKIANILRANDEYEQALEYGQKILSLIEDEMILVDDKTKADCLHELGNIYSCIAQYDQALEYELKALDIRRNLYQGNHPDVANSLSNIGCTYRSLEQYDQALKFALNAFEMQDNLYQGDHTDIAQSLSNIGVVYSSLQQYQQALEYGLKALKIYQNLHQDDHSDLAQSLNNIGVAYSLLKQYQQALEYNFKALEMNKNLYQENHPYIAESLSNIGVSYGLLGEYEKALEYKLKALEMRQNLYEGDHPDIAESLNNTGVAYSSLEQHRTALEYELKALKMRQNLYEGDHPDIAHSLSNIAVSNGSLGRYQTALNCELKALKMRKNLYQGDHSDIAESLCNIAVSYSFLGRYQQALEYNIEALEIYNNLYQGDHPDIAETLDSIGRNHNALGDYEKALEYKLKALKMHKRLWPDDKCNIVNSLNQVGDLYELLGNHEKSLGYRISAFEIYKKSPQKDPIETAQYLINIGKNYSLLKKHDEALEYTSKGLVIYRGFNYDAHPNLANALSILSKAQLSCQKYEEANDNAQKFLEMQKSLYSGNHPEIADALDMLGLTEFLYELRSDKKSISIIDKKIEKLGGWNLAKDLLLNMANKSKSKSKSDPDLNSSKMSNAIKEKAAQYFMQSWEIISAHNLQHKNKMEIASHIKECTESYELLSGSSSNSIKSICKYRLKKYQILKQLLSNASEDGVRPIIIASEAAKEESILDLEPIMSVITGDLNIVIDRAGTKKSGKILLRLTDSPISDKFSITKYIEEKHIKTRLGDNLAADKSNIDRAKMLYLEAICLSIAKVPVEQRNYKCLEEFTKKYPEIVNKAFSHHPEYFIDENILQHCANLPGVKADEEVMKIIPKLNQCFSAEEIETKEEEPEISNAEDLEDQFMLTSSDDQSEEISLSGESV